MAALQPCIEQLPRTIDGRVPRDIRLYTLRLIFEDGGEYSQRELALAFGVSDDTMRRDLTELQLNQWRPVPLVCTRIVEVRWRRMDE